MTVLPAAALPPCLYCRGRSWEPRFVDVADRLRYVPGRWTFWGCCECGSATLSPFPAAGELAAFYPPVYSFTEDLGRKSALRRLLARFEYVLYFRPQYEAQVRRVLRGVGWRRGPGRRLLDVGCGRGLRLLAFRARGFAVHGMDFQPEVVDHLRRSYGISAVCTDIEGLRTAFPPNSFDLVTMFFVLEHVPSVEEALLACRGLLRPGGWLVGAVPFVDSVQARLFKARWINVTEAPRHLSLPTRDGMRRVCERVGLEQVAIVGDSLLNCAGQIGSSLLPGAAITDVYGGGRLPALAKRLVGGVVTLLSIPFCAVENRVLRRPSLGLVFARRPIED